MALEKDNVNYYKFKFEELLKEAEENKIDIGFHIMEISIENKITNKKTLVHDQRMEKRIRNNYYR